VFLLAPFLLVLLIVGFEFYNLGQPMISRNCSGCTQLQLCKIRFAKVRKGEVVSCPDGSRQLVDGA
jgi:hypothetical protein